MEREPFNPFLIRVPAEESARGQRGPMTVSQVTTLIKQALETNLPPTVCVLGEISNIKRHSGGHVYLTLRDRSSELACVMWRSEAAKLKFTPEDGMEVIATGAIEVFERAGRYQLYIRKLEPRGVGARELAFRQLCEKLEREGLFDPARKKPLPAFPRRIVVVTSPTGAAIADMLRILSQRYPCIHVLIYPVRVQGDGAAEEIARAIRRVNGQSLALGGVDVMIVGRGGGSIEDLWAFNEEPVARAMYASRIPIVSAVGHEVDVTIADLVADVRAATPTAAAQLVVPVLEEVWAEVDACRRRLARAVEQKRQLLAGRLDVVLHRAAFRDSLHPVRRRTQVVDEYAARLHRRLTDRLSGLRRRLDGLESIVRRIAPWSFLWRTSVRLKDAEHRLRWVITARFALVEQRWSRVRDRVRQASPVYPLKAAQAKLERIAEQLPLAVHHRWIMGRAALNRGADVLAALSYRSVLQRGFSITRTKRGRAVVRSLAELADRDRVVTELMDGEFESEVVNLRQLELFE